MNSSDYKKSKNKADFNDKTKNILLPKIFNNYKNFYLITTETNSSNVKNKLSNPIVEYFNRLEYLDPQNPNDQMIKVKNKHVNNKIQEHLEKRFYLPSTTENNKVSNSLDFKNPQNVRGLLEDMKLKNSNFLTKIENLAKEKKYEKELAELVNLRDQSHKSKDENFELIKNFDNSILEKIAEISMNNNKIKAIQNEYDAFMKEKMFNDEKSSVIVIQKVEEIHKSDFHIRIKYIEQINETIESEIDLIKNNKLEIRQRIHEIDNSMNLYSEKIEIIRNKLITHYHELLIEGKDTREDGLTWIILAIWNLNREVLLSYFPDYLDEHCIKFLFENSQRIVEVKKIEKELEKLRLEILNKKKKIERNFDNMSKGTFKTELKKDDNNRIIQRNLDINEKIMHNQLKILDIENMLENSRSEKEIQVVINSISILENQKNKLLKSIDVKKSRELERITKEFLFNNYERRFNTNIEKVVNAIVGNAYLKYHMNKIYTDEKVIKDKLKIIKLGMK
jgi:hypothetical protein